MSVVVTVEEHLGDGKEILSLKLADLLERLMSQIDIQSSWRILVILPTS